LGIIAALYERERSGKGQIIDVAIADGVASLFAPILGMIAAGLLPANPAGGMLGGTYPFYRSYVCADGRHFAVGALEPQFRARLAKVLGISVDELEKDHEANRIESIFASRTRDEWAAVFDEEDCCASPILNIEEAADSPHLSARSVYVGNGLDRQPGPAPRFSRTPGAIQADTDAADRLSAWGIARRDPE
jgi:alpha-methylacyl-CoA racemase